MNNASSFYHGSSVVVKEPDLNHSREDIDFGRGFYLTDTAYVAAKWACRKVKSINNEYSIAWDGLSVYKFDLDKEWLDYVVANRNLETPNNRFDNYDILIGPVADDKLFNTIEMYEDGYISAEQAIKIMNCMDYGNQIVIKTEQALKHLRFEGYKEITGGEKEHYRAAYKQDRVIAEERTADLLRKMNGR